MDVMLAMELVGTVAFAMSGAMVAIRKDLDLLGILVVGVTTAVGGGMIRDLIIGLHPPVLFRKPIYVMTAVLAVLLLFVLVRVRYATMDVLESPRYEMVMNWMDALGLGVFTVVGVQAGRQFDAASSAFLQIFLGVITGVGGGFLRDLMVVQTPAILRKHIYACASIAGAVSYVLCCERLGEDISLMIGTALVVIIRVLARHYQWNLPHARKRS